MNPGGRSRAAALALLVGVIAILGALVIVPTALHWSQTGTVIQESRLKTQRADKRAEEAQTLEATKVAWNDFAAEPRAGFVLSVTDEEGIANISKRLKDLFGKFDGTLNSISGEAAEGPRVGVRLLNFQGSGVLPRNNLTPFLTSLESDPAFLIVSEFSARTRSVDQLTIRFSAAAFRLLEPGV